MARDRDDKRGVILHPPTMPSEAEPEFEPELIEVATLVCYRDENGDLQHDVAPAEWLPALEPGAYLAMLIGAESGLAKAIAALRDTLNEGETDGAA